MDSDAALASVLAKPDLCEVLLRSAPDLATLGAMASTCRALRAAAASRLPDVWHRVIAALAPHVAPKVGLSRLRAYKAAIDAGCYDSRVPTREALKSLTFVLHLHRTSEPSEEDDEQQQVVAGGSNILRLNQHKTLLFSGTAKPSADDSRDLIVGSVAFSGAFKGLLGADSDEDEEVPASRFLRTDTCTLLVERVDASGAVHVACLFADAPLERKLHVYCAFFEEDESESEDAEWKSENQCSGDAQLRNFRLPTVPSFVPPYTRISFLSDTLPSVCQSVCGEQFKGLWWREPTWCTVECKLSSSDEAGGAVMNAVLDFRQGVYASEEHGGSEPGGEPLTLEQFMRMLEPLNWR